MGTRGGCGGGAGPRTPARPGDADEVPHLGEADEAARSLGAGYGPFGQYDDGAKLDEADGTRIGGTAGPLLGVWATMQRK